MQPDWRSRIRFALNAQLSTRSIRTRLVLTMMCFEAKKGIYTNGIGFIADRISTRTNTRESRLRATQDAYRQLIVDGYIEPIAHPDYPRYRIRFEKGEDRGLVQD